MRNVLLVSIDSLRYDAFDQVFMDERTDLGSLIDDALVFSNAIAPGPYTEVSIPSTMAGEFLSHDPDDPNEIIDEQFSAHGAIANELKRSGYTTGAFSPNPHASRYYGLDAGFDEFEDFLDSTDRRTALGTFFSRVKSGDFVEGVRLAANVGGLSVPGFGNQSIPLRAYRSDVVQWAKSAERPWFLWVFMLEPHSPFRPTRAYRDTSLVRMLWLNLVWSNLVDRHPTDDEVEKLKRLYTNAVRMTADSIATLFDELREMDPIVVLHSDHGEAFGEHGTFGHDEVLYEENIRVPLAILNADASGIEDAPVSLTQLPSIVRDVATTGDVTPERYTAEAVRSRVPNHSVVARSRDHKTVLGKRVRSYDLDRDPDEESPTQTHSTREWSRLRSFVDHQQEKQQLKEIATDPDFDAD